MLNRIPRNIPPLPVLLAEIGATPRQVARVLQVSERTVYQWLKTGREPWSARIALFWLTRWGYSIIHTDAENEARLFAALARARADQLHELEKAAFFSVVKKTASASNEAVFDSFNNQNNSRLRERPLSLLPQKKLSQQNDSLPG
ncbi:hypothetical protein CUZ56_00485 [Saezia sanguinis]|uniref:Uncharacterized protein n=1 Tax=Saezia sanguinis TaxID=1965230 RepID=A0A433SH03_9BURK|nr:hypothetical protein CUZ56_00485 [Saezia sanguinis]